LSYPGLSPEAKVELWRSVCAPSISWLNTIYLKSGNVRKLDKVQGSLIKQSFGLSKFAHYAPLLKSLNIDDTKTVISDKTTNALRRTMEAPLKIAHKRRINQYSDNIFD
jgi:hypothetical protein